MNTIFKMALALIIAVVPSGFVLAEDGSTAQVDAEIVRYLHEVQFAPSFKHGIQVFVATHGQTNAMLHAISAAPDDEIINAALPAYQKRLTVAQARAIADFYSTDTGKTITRQQVAHIDNPNAPVNLTKEQHEALAKFAATDAGKADLRINQADLWAEVNDDIRKAFGAKIASGILKQ